MEQSSSSLSELQSQVIDLQKRLGAVQNVIDQVEWPAEERIAYAKILLESFRAPDAGGCATWTTLTRHSGPSLVGLKPGRFGQALEKLHRNGLLSREQVKTKVGSEVKSYMLTRVPVTITELPERLERTEREDKARDRAEKNQNELKRLAAIGRELEKLHCPNCGTEGLSITCEHCHSTFTLDELEKMIGVAPSVRNSQPETNPPHYDETPAEDDQDAKFATLDTVPCEICTAIEGSTEAAPHEDISLSASLPSVTPAGMGDVLQGIETIECLDAWGIEFTLIPAPGAIMPNGDTSDGKTPINLGDDDGESIPWTKAHVNGEGATRWAERGGNVGMQCKDGWILLDVDDSFGEFLQHYLTMGLPGRFERENAPDRAKLLLRVKGECPTRKYSGNGHRIEILSEGAQGVIAGKHHTGAPIRFVIGELIEFSFDALDAMCKEWTAQPKVIEAPTRRAAMSVQPSADLVRAAIQWKNNDPAFLNTVEIDLKGCKHAGRYVSVRPDDDTPSTIEARDAFAQTTKRMWFDHGSKEALDAVELHVRINGLDKRQFIWRNCVNEYLVAMGRQPLAL